MRFGSPDGLRLLLHRLHAAGPDAWREDTEAAALMRFTADRYAALARKYGQQPADAAAAAFETMRTRATRTAADPWAVITVAVRLTLLAEHRANGLLTSARRARRTAYTAHHDAERFSDRAVDLAEHHPGLHHHDPDPDTRDPIAELWVIDAAADVFADAGWPRPLAITAVTHVCERLADIGSRAAAYECLRRDKAIRAQLDLSHHGWIALLRATLGHPTAPGSLRHGILARLLAGEPAEALAADGQLAAIITTDQTPQQAVGW